MEFEWDKTKDRSNLARHGISFNEAAAIFADPNVVILDASRDEDNEIRGKALDCSGSECSSSSLRSGQIPHA